MENILKDKIKLGISACQYGAKFRYNGKGRDITELLGRDKGSFFWTPVCPEVMSGLGIPRTAIKLSKGNGNDFWEGNSFIKDRYGKNLSEKLKIGAEYSMNILKMADIDIYIYMDGSPSCGITRTSLKNKKIGNPPGIFGSLLLRENFFLISALDLENPLKWWDCKRRLVTYHWLKKIDLENIENRKNVWDLIKYLVEELSLEKFNEINLELENENYNFVEEIQNILKKSSTVEKIKEYLWKNYLILEKMYDVKFNINSPEVLRSSTEVYQEILEIQKYVRQEDKFFASSPINYKP
ncbi:MAG: DUF523 domain-containing protein [Cetobacterium sp.]|uniref:DUF523 domain-containing protein n=1 Tax=Cetobacterium sp. TaxID=2071632 RepID=UPI003F306CEA